MTTAGLIRRLMAAGVDTLFLASFMAGALALRLVDIVAYRPRESWFWTEWLLKSWLDSPWLVVKPWLIFFLASTLAHTLLEFLHLSPGNRLLGLEVIDKNGNKPSAVQFFLRWIGLQLSILNLGLGYLWIFASRHRRSLHDILSGTAIARTK